MRDLNYGALWAISIHEVYPGHFLHYQHLRRLESKLRKSILFASTSFIEGCRRIKRFVLIAGNFRKVVFLFIGHLSQTSHYASVKLHRPS